MCTVRNAKKFFLTSKLLTLQTIRELCRKQVSKSAKLGQILLFLYLKFHGQFLGRPVSRVHEGVTALRTVRQPVVAALAKEVTLRALINGRLVRCVKAHGALQCVHQIVNVVVSLQKEQVKE